MAKKPQKDRDESAVEHNLGSLKDEFHKRWGQGSLMEMSGFASKNVETIPSGSIALDKATGVGGIPRGRIVEVFGPEGAGKTMMTLHWVVSVQRANDVAAFIDAEHALDAKFAADIGVDLHKLLLSQPDSGEQALEMVELLVRSNVVKIIVVDSVAALTPQAEIEGEMGESHIGAQARLMSQGLRKLTAAVKKSNAIVVFINQLRMKIGQMGMGNPETTPGGRALKFYAGMRLDIRKNEAIKDGELQIGHRAMVKVVKNKVAAPFKKCIVPIIYGEGISRPREILELGLMNKIIEQSGSWLSYGETRIGLGVAKATAFLKSNPEVTAEIETKLKQVMADELDSHSEPAGDDT